MPLIRPSLSNIVQRVRGDLTAALPDLNPLLNGSFVRAIVESVAIRLNALYLFVEQAQKEAFPQTATGVNLERFGLTVTRNPASGATGTVGIFGNALTIIPIGTAMTSPEGTVYRTQETVTLAQQVLAISSLSSSSGIATAVSNGHSLVTGQDLTISGAVDAEYNGTVAVTVIDANTFSYPVDGSPNSPTSGAITGSYTGALAVVQSEGQGVETNQGDGVVLTITSPIAGAESRATVRFDGITGGADIEGDESLRDRILEERSAIRANFSADALSVRAKTVPGVTRVKVRQADPVPGDVTVNFVRDGDLNIIPSAADVANVREVLLEILPATSLDSALIVAAPSPVSVDFAFSAVSPNTDAMKEAIEASIRAFFEDDVQIGESLTEDAYRSAILNTVADDEPLVSFTLTTPSGNVAITADQIAVVGDISFA